MIALLATSGAMAETIPPSFVSSMIGTIAGLSNRDLFTAGLLPAFVAAPPLGVGYYGACAIGKCAPDEAVKPMLPYILALIVSLVVVAAVPWLSTGFIAH